jgi:tetratricopeptide (TPR) repeat protein
MFELKRLSRDAVPTALEKALRYRLLNEPGEAESICHDVLSVDPENQQALVTLLLALTDRFGKDYAVEITQAQEILSRLQDPYEKAYYAGIICERRAKAHLHRGYPGSGHDAYEFLREAMGWFEKAETLHPAKNDDALLHWNTCARLIMRNQLTSRPEEKVELSWE